MMPQLILCELNETGDPMVESYSPFCWKVRRALSASGLPWTSRRRARPDLHRDVNPLGQVPVLLIDGEPVADSTVILQRLEQLAPSGLSREERAEAELYEELADTALYGFVLAARWADEEGWERLRERFFADAPWPVRALVAPRLRSRVVRGLVARDVWRAGPEVCWARFERLLDQLDVRAPRTDFWVGPRRSAADHALFAQLQSFRCQLTPRHRAAVERRPRLTAYLERMVRSEAPAARAA